MPSRTELVGVFETLAAQHDEVSALLERAKQSDAAFVELWPTIRSELRSHEMGELREVYPAIRSYPETRDLADHHDAEATELEQLVATVDALPAAAPQRREVFQQLIDTVLHHAREEETSIFPQAQSVMGEAAAVALEPKLMDAKQKIAAQT